MALTTTTHLNLPGTAQSALNHYQEVFGGEVSITTYAQVGMPAEAPGSDKVVFGLLESATGLRLMAYDIPGQEQLNTGTTRRENGATITDQPFFVAVRADSLDEAMTYWSKLSARATIIEALAASPWSAGFGMLTDEYGVTWVVDVAG